MNRSQGSRAREKKREGVVTSFDSFVTLSPSRATRGDAQKVAAGAEAFPIRRRPESGPDGSPISVPEALLRNIG